MLYIKDYGSLNRLVNGGKREPLFWEELRGLCGKTVAVHTAGACVCGLLIGISPERVTLSVPVRARMRRGDAARRVEIAVDKITAVFFSSL